MSVCCFKPCQSGWPQRGQVPDVLKPYYPVAAEFTMEDGILMRGQRIVIPASLCVEILEKLHEGHQGIVKFQERARQSVQWLGLSRCLEELVKSCPECCKHKVQRPQPFQPSEIPQLPWQKVATNLFQWRKSSYLLVMDYYSQWIEVARLTSETSEAVTRGPTLQIQRTRFQDFTRDFKISLEISRFHS